MTVYITNENDQTAFNAYGRVPAKFRVLWTTPQEVMSEVEYTLQFQNWHIPATKSWSEGLNQHETLAMAHKGNIGTVADMLKDVEQFSSTISQAQGFRLVNSYAGSPNIGRYLSGRPDCMRTRSRVELQTRSVRVFFSVCASEGFSCAQLMKRAAAVLGLIECLRACQVQTDLFMVGEMGCLQVLEIPSRPLDLSMSGFFVGHPAFWRNVLFPWVRDKLGHVDWAPGRHDQQMYQATVRKSLGLEDSDIFIPSGYYSKDDEILKNPKAWVEKHIIQVTGVNHG